MRRRARYPLELYSTYCNNHFRQWYSLSRTLYVCGHWIVLEYVEEGLGSCYTLFKLLAARRRGSRALAASSVLHYFAACMGDNTETNGPAGNVSSSSVCTEDVTQIPSEGARTILIAMRSSKTFLRSVVRCTCIGASHSLHSFAVTRT